MSSFRLKNERLLLAILLVGPLGYYVNYICSIIGIAFSTTQLIAIITSICALIVYFKLLCHLKKRVFIIFIITILCILLSILQGNGKYIFPASWSFSSFYGTNIYCFIILSLPVLLLMIDGININEMFSEGFILCMVISLLQILTFILTLMLRTAYVSSDYMTFSYNGILSTFGLFFIGYQKKRKIAYVIGSINFVVIFLAGCRGAILTIGIFLIGWYIFSNKSISYKSLLVSIFIIVLLAVMLLYSTQILSEIRKFLDNYGFSSRVLNILLNDPIELAESSGRDTISSKLTENLNLFGHGIFGDRRYVGAYAHNWLLEIIFDFGLIGVGGIVFLIAIFIKGIRTLNLYDDYLRRGIVIGIAIVFGYLGGRYLVSASYLVSGEFFMSIGIIYNINKKIQ